MMINDAAKIGTEFEKSAQAGKKIFLPLKYAFKPG
jgi:hypothetical protein